MDPRQNIFRINKNVDIKKYQVNCSYQHNYKGDGCLMLLSTIDYIMTGAVVAVIVW